MNVPLRPILVNPQVMDDLEEKGLISRLLCNRINLCPQPGYTNTSPRYPTARELGGHKLLQIAVNREIQDLQIGEHEYYEEVLLINAVEHQKPLIWVFSSLSIKEMQNKINNKQLSSKDFIAVSMAFGVPYCSFFMIPPHVLHGEFTYAGSEQCPRFFVTEPELMTYNRVNFSDISFSLDD